MISISWEPISVAEPTGGLPWVDLGVGGWPAERQQSVFGDWGGHPDTGAESMISTSLEQISAAERTVARVTGVVR